GGGWRDDSQRPVRGAWLRCEDHTTEGLTARGGMRGDGTHRRRPGRDREPRRAWRHAPSRGGSVRLRPAKRGCDGGVAGRPVYGVHLVAVRETRARAPSRDPLAVVQAFRPAVPGGPAGPLYVRSRIESMTVTSATNSSLHAAIASDGFAFVHGRAMR